MKDDGRWTLEDVYNDLGGRAEIQRVLDIGYPRLHQWIHRGEEIGIPKPIRKISSVNIYSMVEWQGWYERWLLHDKKLSHIRTVRHSDGKNFFTYRYPPQR